MFSAQFFFFFFCFCCCLFLLRFLFVSVRVSVWFYSFWFLSLSSFLSLSLMPGLHLSFAPSPYPLLSSPAVSLLLSSHFTACSFLVFNTHIYVLFNIFYSSLNVSGHQQKRAACSDSVHVYKFHTFPNTLTHIFVLAIQFLPKKITST